MLSKDHSAEFRQWPLSSRESVEWQFIIWEKARERVLIIALFPSPAKPKELHRGMPRQAQAEAVTSSLKDGRTTTHSCGPLPFP